jgi:GrpB-like predicted nucleotidyltransferase (UPF0157 family)
MNERRLVVIVPYNADWPSEAKALESVYVNALDGLAVRVEHVGSTSVPELSAKPIIDIDVVIENRSTLNEVIERLSALGYRHEGDLGVAGRESFSSDGATDVPRDGTGRHWMAHHLYVCGTDCAALDRHLRFRDWLRSNRDGAAAYGRLKANLAGAFPNDRERYTRGKTAFIEAALRTMAVPAPPLGKIGSAVNSF